MELYIILDHYNKRGLLCYCQHLCMHGNTLDEGVQEHACSGQLAQALRWPNHTLTYLFGLVMMRCTNHSKYGINQEISTPVHATIKGPLRSNQFLYRRQ